MKITIAKALREAARLKGEYNRLNGQLFESRVIQHQEGEVPPYKFAEIWEKMLSTKERIAQLKGAIAVANATNYIIWNGNSVSLAEAIVRLQEIRGFIALLERVQSVSAASEAWEARGQARYDDQRNVVYDMDKYVAHMTKARAGAMAEAERRMFDELNGLVETANHTSSFNFD